MPLTIRPATPNDLPRLERRCWPGGEDEIRRRIHDQGASSILALDGARIVGQLYIRAHQPGFRAPSGLHDGGWWADLSGIEDQVSLPARTALLGCWHVGRTRDAQGEEHEAPQYRGKGVGLALLQGAIDWLDAAPFDALAFKAADSDARPYLGWLGGLPHSLVEPLGFRTLATFDDPYLLAEPEAPPPEARLPNAARFHLVLRERLPDGAPPRRRVHSP